METLSRRDFLKKSSFVVASLAVSSIIPDSHARSEELTIDHTQQQNPSILDSAFMGAMWGTANNLVAIPISRRLAGIRKVFDLKAIDAGLESMSRTSPWLAYGLAPVIEESIFRGIPGLLVLKRPDLSDLAGFSSSLIFGLAHLSNRETEPNFRSAIPSIFPRFLSGMIYWRIFRERGLNHSIAAHSSQNLATTAVMTYMADMLRKLESRNSARS